MRLVGLFPEGGGIIVADIEQKLLRSFHEVIPAAVEQHFAPHFIIDTFVMQHRKIIEDHLQETAVLRLKCFCEEILLVFKLPVNIDLVDTAYLADDLCGRILKAPFRNGAYSTLQKQHTPVLVFSLWEHFCFLLFARNMI